MPAQQQALTLYETYETYEMKLILLCANLFFAIIARGQRDVSDYKKVSDNFINQKFVSKFSNDISFTDFYTTTVDSSYWHYEKDEIEQNTIDSFISVTFKYTFYSQRLNFLLPFTITVGKNCKINNFEEINWDIPECILRDSICNLMTKDKALQIAFNKRLASTKEYEIEFARPLHRKDYYWLISKIIGYNPNTKDPYLGEMKVVNAKNGNVLTWEQYLLPE